MAEMEKAIQVAAGQLRAVAGRMRDHQSTEQNLEVARDLEAIAKGLERGAFAYTFDMQAPGYSVQAPSLEAAEALLRNRLVQAVAPAVSRIASQMATIYVRRLADGSEAPPGAGLAQIHTHYLTARFLIVPLSFGD